MAKEAFQLNSKTITVYEEQKVTSMFGPLARATIDAVGIDENDVILDIACGTGIVGRTIIKDIRPISPIVGMDLNSGMIEMARSITAPQSSSFDWHVADVEKLPFDSGKFTAVFCQQGIQYFPDDQAALKEMRRVMVEDGKLILTVWGGASDFFVEMAKSVSKHVGSEIADRYLAPFSYAKIDQLTDMLLNAGFGDVLRETLVVDRTMLNTKESIPKEILGHPAGPQIEQAGTDIVRAIAEDVSIACKEYQRGDDMIVPQLAHMFVAVAN